MEINKIYQGDCLELMKQIPDKSIDMILCDLPYGTAAYKWDNVIPFEPLWLQYKRIIKDNRAVVLFGKQPFTSKLVISNFRWFKYEWIWDKRKGNNFSSANRKPFDEHENILVFYTGKMTYNPQKIKRSDYSLKCHPIGSKHLVPSTGKVGGDGGFYAKPHYYSKDGYRLPRSIIEIKQLNGRGAIMLHPTQKPIALFEYLIKTYTNEGDLVLDNCIGSGTTAIACLQTNRNFIGMELEEKYVDIANKRIQEHKQQLVLV